MPLFQSFWTDVGINRSDEIYVQDKLNVRPRERFGFGTPNNVFFWRQKDCTHELNSSYICRRLILIDCNLQYFHKSGASFIKNHLVEIDTVSLGTKIMEIVLNK